MSLAATPRATVTVLRGLIDEARRKDYRHGVFGVRAQPVWTDADVFVHDGVTVRVVPCVSTLAVREALLEHEPGTWLVVLTDRSEADLGPGLCAHLLWNRLRTSDPWAVLRQVFAATGIDPALTSAPDHRELGAALLTVAQQDAAPWPAAPAGILTRDHAFTAVSGRTLGVSAAVGVPDAAAVLGWTTVPDAAARVAALRAAVGDLLADALLDWLAARTGAATGAVRAVLRSGDLRDVVPLGLVVGLLDGARGSAGPMAQTAEVGLARLEKRSGNAAVPPPAARSWGIDAAATVRQLSQDSARGADHERVLARADALLEEAGATLLAAHSLDLPSGLESRLGRLGDALRAATTHAAGAAAEADAPRIAPPAAADVEAAWTAVTEHRGWGPGDPRHAPVLAAVRLTRWLATDTIVNRPGLQAAGAGVGGLTRRHVDDDAWVDSAIHDAERGVADPELGAALTTALASARARRSIHDRAFAAALADHTRGAAPAPSGAVQHLEDVLASKVLPVAKHAPVLLLVLDGMSAAVATEVLTAATRPGAGWAEALWSSVDARSAALAVLPTLTSVSRTSLLCGELRTGQQTTEQSGFEALTRAHGVPAVLFHKKPLDSSRPGHEVADDVGAAVDDVSGRPLIACVLNTIDDALDRSDPGGTDWNLDTIKHLRPLLDRARHAGRVVVLTSDHGHIIERRAGTQRSYPEISSGRSRAAGGGPAGDGEVLVEGPRVLEHRGRAVLAVDELLRYGPLKAGYHGGASPAEVVVPVAFLVPGVVPDGLDLLRLAPPQEPLWWNGSTVPAAAPLPPATTPAKSRPAARSRGQQTEDLPTLFDVPALDPATEKARRASIADAGSLFAPLADAVIASGTYTAQKQLAGRGLPSDEQIRSLLTALLGSPGNRLSQVQFAAALKVPTTLFNGVVAQVQRLLNVDGYSVLARDADGVTVILDEGLLREQFGVGP